MVVVSCLEDEQDYKNIEKVDSVVGMGVFSGFFRDEGVEEDCCDSNGGIGGSVQFGGNYIIDMNSGVFLCCFDRVGNIVVWEVEEDQVQDNGELEQERYDLVFVIVVED